MKILLGGSTGFLGKEVLAQCLKDERITSIIALSRRDIPSTDPKLKVVKMDDFNTYPDSVLKECAGAEACIWALGSVRDPDIETTRRINVDYTMAAANAFTILGNGASQFRFVYVSGMMVEKDRQKKTWVLSEPRYVRGETESQLIELGAKSPSAFQTFIARPGFILNSSSIMPGFVKSIARANEVDDVAAVLLDTAVNGGTLQAIEWNEINSIANALTTKRYNQALQEAGFT